MSIYVSKSKNVPNSLYCELIRTMQSWEIFLPVSCWEHDEVYTSDKLDNADTVILLFDQSSQYIGKGAYDEMIKSIKNNKSTFLAYKRKSDNTFQFYSFSLLVNTTKANWSNYSTVSFGDNITEFTIRALKSKSKKYMNEITQYPRIPSDSYKLNVLDFGTGKMSSKNEAELMFKNNENILLLLV